MEKLIVIVFDNQAKAFAGLEALRELDRDGEISLFAAQIAAKEPNGGVRFIDNPNDADFPVIGVSTLLGTLVGVFGGPIGLRWRRRCRGLNRFHRRVGPRGSN